MDWTAGPQAIAQRLCKTYTLDIDEGPRCDPRGMRASELKKKLANLGDFSGDLSDVSKYQSAIIAEWQRMYDSYMNGNIKLPGRDPAGPFTFHKPSDKEGVRLTYDKHGRVEH